MIDSNKSVIIFSHPRSGSTWFQDGFSQYNLSELFNIYLKYTINNGIHFSYSPAYCGNTDKNIELHNRFEIYNQFVEQYGAVSVKLHCNHYNDTIGSFLKTIDTHYILLERRDKIKTLWSLLIAWCTLELHITTVITSKNQKSVTISKDVFDQCVNILKQCDNNSRIIISKYNPTIIYYENLLNDQYPNWWTPNSRYLIQNAKEYTNIINVDEVNNWISNFTELH